MPIAFFRLHSCIIGCHSETIGNSQGSYSIPFKDIAKMIKLLVAYQQIIFFKMWLKVICDYVELFPPLANRLWKIYLRKVSLSHHVVTKSHPFW